MLFFFCLPASQDYYLHMQLLLIHSRKNTKEQNTLFQKDASTLLFKLCERKKIVKKAKKGCVLLQSSVSLSGSEVRVYLKSLFLVVKEQFLNIYSQSLSLWQKLRILSLFWLQQKRSSSTHMYTEHTIYRWKKG